MSAYEKPQWILHIPRARLYTRDNSPNLWFEYRNNEGKVVRRSAGTTNLADAWTTLLRDFENQNELTFEEGVQLFFEKREDELRPNTLRQYAFAAKALQPFMEGKLMKDIRPADVRTFIEARQQSVKDASIKRELAFLSGLFSFLIKDNDQAHLDNPVKKVNQKRLKEGGRTRQLDANEYHRLLDACLDPTHKLIVKTAVLTGMRHGELLDFRISWIDWEKREIIIPEEAAKSKAERIIPMNDELFSLLRAHCRRTKNAHVFTYMDRIHKDTRPYTTFKNWFKAAIRRAKLEDMRFHDLRHTFGSRWVQADGNILALKEVLGHSTVKMTERYSHMDRRTLHETTEKVAAHTKSTLTRFLKTQPRRAGMKV